MAGRDEDALLMHRSSLQWRRVYPSAAAARNRPCDFGGQELGTSGEAVGIATLDTSSSAPEIIAPVTVAPADGLNFSPDEVRYR